MQAGKLRHRVTFKSPSTGHDDIGQPIDTWTPAATVWADVRFPNGLETIKASAVAVVKRASIVVRHRTDLNERMRVEFKGEDFEVKSVAPDPTDARYLSVVCEAIA